MSDAAADILDDIGRLRDIAVQVTDLGSAFSKTGNTVVGSKLQNLGGDLGYYCMQISRTLAALDEHPTLPLHGEDE